MKAFTTFLVARAQSARQLLGLFLILLSALCPRVGWGQATLPASHNGPWANGLPNGWSQDGLGTDYSSNLGTNNVGGSAKFDDAGDFLTIYVSGVVGNLTYYVKGNPSSSTSTEGTFVVEESADATSYSILRNILNKDNVTQSFTNILLPSSRYIRFRYAVKISGNIQLDQVALTAADSGPTNPTITVPAGPLTFNTTVGTPSAEQSYNVSGINLTEPISITATAGYQLSATSGSYVGATNTLQLSTTGGTVYGRLSGAATGTYNGDITHSSTGATASVAVLGNVAAAPVASIVASPTSISGLSATQGTASPSQMYTLTPTALTAPITVTAPTGFEVSLASASGFATSVTASRTAATAVYVRIVATAAAGPVSGTITNVSGSTSQDVPVSGMVSMAPVGGSVLLMYDFDTSTPAEAPSFQASNITGSNFSNGSGVNNIVISNNYRAQSWTTNSTLDTNDYFEFTFTPAINYSSDLQNITLDERRSGTGIRQWEIRSSLDGYASTIGSIVSVPDNTNVRTGQTITLDAAFNAIGGAVTFRIYAYAAEGGTGTWYVDNVRLSGTINTYATLAAEPTVQPTVSVTNVTSGTADVTVAGGNGTARLVVIRPTATAAAAPIDGASYTASTTYGAGATTGPDNYVLVADGTTTSFTVTGLSPLTDYTVAVYAYNGSGGTQNYLTTVPGTAAFTTPDAPVVTYTWNGTSNSWSAASSWTPARSVPAASDILVFDGNVTGSATADLDFTASQTISQLRLINRVSVTLINAGSGRTLLLDGGTAGDDLAIGASSALRLQPSTAAAPITIDITTGETARIAGAFTSDAATNSMAANRLIGRDASSIVVPMGGLFVAGPKSIGGPFDGSATNAVVFESGANYRQEGGTSPFDQQQPAAVVQFQRGSVYEFARMDGSAALSGRTYGTLRFSTISAGLANMIGASTLTILDNLEVAAATEVGINLTNGVFIGGNVLVDAGGSLNFNPGSASAVTFNGSTAQTISGPGPVVFGSASTLTVDNARGVTLLSPVQANGGLDLQSGLLTTTDINLLTLAATSTIGGGSNASFVNGPVARVLPANTTGSRLFPVGKDGAYRPVTLTPTTLTRATTVTVEQLEGPTAPQPFNDGIVRVSRVRRYAITASPGITAPGTFMGTVTLSFGPDDKVTDPAQSSLLIAQSDGTVWNSVGRSTSSGAADNGAFVAGTLTSALFQTFDAFSVFVLASTDPDVAVNPLPVQLLSFGAERRAGSVQIQWATATELNSAHFEVQRSTTGQDFRTVSTVAAQGSSSTRHEYSVSDRQPLPGTSYYRLRQVDLDGTDAYSAVASVDALGEVRVYPNPVETELTIELPTAGARYRIISVLGSVLMFGEVPTTTAMINVAALPAGLYQLEITTSAGRDIRKIIKQ